MIDSSIFSLDIRLIIFLIVGIGKTVREKVCVHTSRDIRAIASQLVNVWLEVFRKEKASAGLKLARQSNAVDFSKRKPLKDPGSGKPPLRSNSDKGSAGSHLLLNSNIKKGNGKSVKLETVSQTLPGRMDDEVEQKTTAMSEEEQAAFAAAEAARVAAEAAARAAAEATAKVCCHNMLLYFQPSQVLPLICWIDTVSLFTLELCLLVEMLCLP